MNSPDISPSRMGDSNTSTDHSSKNWKVSDSFKITKLRVTSREELQTRKVKEDQRKRDASTTSDAKSYLKSRRSKARNERRSDILSVLDHNLEKIVPTSQDSHKDSRSSSRSPVRDSRSRMQYRVAANNEYKDNSSSTSNNTMASRNRSGSSEDSHTISPTSSSPKQQNRLRVLNPFRNKSKDIDVEKDKPTRNESGDSGKRNYLKRLPSDRPAARHRKEAKEGLQREKQGHKRDEEAEMQEILEDVLRKYPKEKCRTFADHKEFAFAELSTQSNHRKDLQITTEKFLDLKSKLRSRLASTLGKDGSDVVADATRIRGQTSGQQTNQQHLLRNQSHGSPRHLRNQLKHNQGRELESILSTSSKRQSQQSLLHHSTADTSSPGRASRIQAHRSTGPSSPNSPSLSSPSSNSRSLRNRTSPQTKNVSPRRMSIVQPPSLAFSSDAKSPTSPRSDDFTTTESSQKRRSTVSISSESLPLPKARSMSLDDHLPLKKVSSDREDGTSMTELDDESTLVPVVKVLIMDPSGNIGKYTGTICINTGKPQGSGKIEYESGGSYDGDWNQGSWSGFGLHAKSNGDIYEGTFFDNSKHGMGTYRYRDGKRVFEGRYVMGQRIDGQMTYGDGSIYKGQWYDGKRHGRGIYRFKDSSIYKGEFLQDVIHGVGQLVWPDGAKYVGEWNQGHRHGMGKEFASDGRLRYEGKWKDSVPAS
jgi:hypothetical protein